MDEDTDKFIIFKQDNCDKKLYQSRKDESIYLFPDPDNSDQWLVKHKIVEDFREDGCKIVEHGEVLFRLEKEEGTILIPKSGSAINIIKLEDCKTYPKIELSPSPTDFKVKAMDYSQISNYFGVDGELNWKNKNEDIFFMTYSFANNEYRFYDSQNIIYLTQKNDDDTKFMVFKADFLETFDASEGSQFIFPDGEYEYEYYRYDNEQNYDDEAYDDWKFSEEPELETEYPPFYAIKLGEDTDFTIFEQDICGPKLYQSKENRKTYLYPNPDNADEWFLNTDVEYQELEYEDTEIKKVLQNKDCKRIMNGENLCTLKDLNGTLIQISGSAIVKILKLENCKTYPQLTLSPRIENYVLEANNEAQILNYFAKNGEMKNSKGNFFMTSLKNIYRFYDSQYIVYLTRINDDDTKFMVFKSDCLDSLEMENSFGENQLEYLFPNTEYDYYDEYFEENTDVDELATTENVPLIIGVSLAIIFAIVVIITVVCVLRMKKICCFQDIKSKVDGDVKVHQNDLYGNLSNQEEWQERYDTNIIDTNTYYEDFNSGEQYGQNEDDKDKADTEDSTKEDHESKV